MMEMKGDMTGDNQETRHCLVCEGLVPFEEECYQVCFGAISEADEEFVPDHDTGYAHLGCLRRIFSQG